MSHQRSTTSHQHRAPTSSHATSSRTAASSQGASSSRAGPSSQATAAYRASRAHKAKCTRHRTPPLPYATNVQLDPPKYSITITPYPDETFPQYSPAYYAQHRLPPLQHCARCHRSYRHTSDPCVVPHVFDGNRTTADWDGRSVIYDAACCGYAVLAIDRGGAGVCDVDAPDGRALCFVGRHTPRHTEVGYNDANIHPCRVHVDRATGDGVARYYCNRAPLKPHSDTTKVWFEHDNEVDNEYGDDLPWLDYGMLDDRKTAQGQLLRGPWNQPPPRATTRPPNGGFVEPPLPPPRRRH